MKYIILILLTMISTIVAAKSQPIIPDATCLEVYYYEVQFKESNDSDYKLIDYFQDKNLFCSNNESVAFDFQKNGTIHITLDSMTYHMQTQSISIFRYAAHSEICNFEVTFSFNKKAATQNRYMVRIENLTLPLLFIYHLNPESI